MPRFEALVSLLLNVTKIEHKLNSQMIIQYSFLYYEKNQQTIPFPSWKMSATVCSSPPPRACFASCARENRLRKVPAAHYQEHVTWVTIKHDFKYNTTSKSIYAFQFLKIFSFLCFVDFFFFCVFRCENRLPQHLVLHVVLMDERFNLK